MNWDAIGSIGEIVGAAAVVLTLAYLAVQVRHAKEAAADVSRLNRGIGVRELLMRKVSDDELRESWIKAEGSADSYGRIAEALGVAPEQGSKIEYDCQCWFWLHWAHWASTKTDADLDELKHIIAGFYSSPPMSTVWALSPNVQLLEPEFVRFVNSAIEDRQSGQPFHGT